MMKTKRILFAFISLIFMACSSIKNEQHGTKGIEEKMTLAVEKAGIRNNYIQFMEMLEDSNRVNAYSENIIEDLISNEYREGDIHKLFNVEIEKVFFNEILHLKWDIVGTTSMIYIIDGIKYVAHYVIDFDTDAPNIYTLVYVYSNQEKTNIRVFYKINYNLEYYILTSGDEKCNVFF